MHRVQEAVIKISDGPVLSLSEAWVMLHRICRGSNLDRFLRSTEWSGKKKSWLRPETHILALVVHSLAA